MLSELSELSDQEKLTIRYEDDGPLDLARIHRIHELEAQLATAQRREAEARAVLERVCKTVAAIQDEFAYTFDTAAQLEDSAKQARAWLAAGATGEASEGGEDADQ